MSAKMQIKQEQHREELDGLKSIARGGGMVFMGTILSTALVFVLTALIARHLTQNEFGLFALGLGFIKIFSVLAGLGFQQGIPRYIAYQLGKEKYHKAWSSIVSSLLITSLISPCVALLLYFNADIIAQLLQKPGLATTVRIMSLCIPIMALINLLVSYLRAVHETKGRVYFQNILRPLIGIILMSAVIFLSLSFSWVLWSYALSFFVTLIALLFFTKNKISKFIRATRYSAVTKDIISFSLPVLGAGILSQMLDQTDTILLGYFEPAASVGQYTAALRLAQFIPIISMSVGFIYLPVATRFFSQNKICEISALYTMITKWTFLLTLPFFLSIFFAPNLMLLLSFGAKYIMAKLPLQILSIGFFLHVSLGLNAMTCIALGKPKMVFFCQFITLVTNFLLDLLLIPQYGITGAAIASSISLVLNNILLTSFVYNISKIHPFTKSYLQAAFPVSGIVAIIFFLSVTFHIHYGILLIMLLLSISLILVLVITNINEDEISMFAQIEKKITNKTYFTDKLTSRINN
jgi:O-antigen/teichoic acid export membrane protein